MQGTSKYVLLPIFIGAVVLLIALTLLTIIALGPYTHANLDARYDPLQRRWVGSVARQRSSPTRQAVIHYQGMCNLSWSGWPRRHHWTFDRWNESGKTAGSDNGGSARYARLCSGCIDR
jgi:hypothetical protein